MTPRTLRNWILWLPACLLVWGWALACLAQTDEVAVGLAWQNDSGWTEVPYPPASGGMYFVDQDGGNDSNDGRDPHGFGLSTATYTHGSRTLTSSGAFSGYTHTGGDGTDVIYLSDAAGSGVADGWYVIESKTSNDAIVLEAAAGLTGDDTSIASSSGPKATPAAGTALLSDGVGNHLLFQRGDTWTITSDLGIASGASATEPQVYGAYGPLTTAQPKIICDGVNGFRNVGALSYVYFVGLHLQGDMLITEGKNGIDIVSNTDGSGTFLIEDNLVEKFATNVQFSAQNGQLMHDVTIRRNVIINAEPGVEYGQGIYGSKFDGLLLEENIFYHNGWTDDWQDTAVMATGTTAAYTNGDTLTLTCVRYGAFTAATLADTLDLELIDTNDASGTVDSVTYNPTGADIEVRLDLTTGVASNVVASAIQSYNGGADLTCTSSGTADLVLADAGAQNNVMDGTSYDPAIYNHHVYFGGNNTFNLTMRSNVFGKSCHMAMKIDSPRTTIIEHDNLMVNCDRWGHVGNSDYVTGDGSYVYVYNNVLVESEANANSRSNGATIKNTLQGYYRNNFVGQRTVAEGSSGDAIKLTGPEDITGGDTVGVNNVVFDANVFYNFHGTVTMELGPQSGDNGWESNDNTWSNNVVANTSDDTNPLIDTYLTDSDEMVYSGTNWWSTQSTATEWMEADGSPVSTTNWQSTYEATATFTNPTSGFTDPTRTATTYATDNGYTDWDDLMDDLITQRRGDWDETIMAEAVNDYIRAGFDMSEYSPSATKKVLILQ